MNEDQVSSAGDRDGRTDRDEVEEEVPLGGEVA